MTGRFAEPGEASETLIAGFLTGCALGAICEPAFGLFALAVPALLSLVAIGFGLNGSMSGAARSQLEG